MVSTFRSVLDGMVTKLGLFDVVLPFLLVFAITFAALEKSRVLGVYKEGSVEYTKKNLNAIVALAIAFFVVASSRLVGIIIGFSTNGVLLILFSVIFLMVAGLFFKDGEVFTHIEKYKTFFIWATFVILLLVFLGVMGWLGTIWHWIVLQWNIHRNDSLGAGIFLFIVVIGAMFFITSGGPKKTAGDKK